MRHHPFGGIDECGEVCRVTGARSERSEDPMGRHEKKVDHKLEELGGKAKEAVGRATDDEELEAQGELDQTKGNLKQAGDKVKDAFRR